MYLRSRLFRGQVALLIAVLTMMFWTTDVGIGIAILVMGLAAYWIFTAESHFLDRLRIR